VGKFISIKNEDQVGGGLNDRAFAKLVRGPRFDLQLQKI
jgi:hypothetical protein